MFPSVLGRLLLEEQKKRTQTQKAQGSPCSHSWWQGGLFSFMFFITALSTFLCWWFDKLFRLCFCSATFEKTVLKCLCLYFLFGKVCLILATFLNCWRWLFWTEVNSNWNVMLIFVKDVFWTNVTFKSFIFQGQTVTFLMPIPLSYLQTIWNAQLH